MIQDWSVCLGAMEVTLLELTGAHATFANKGQSVSPYGILEIRTRKGEILYQYQDPDPIQVVAPDKLKQMNQLFSAVVDRGTGRRAKVNCPMGGKSGSNADKDAWFIGFTNELVTGIWTGNDNNAPMHQDSTGGRLPAMTFATFMKPIVEGKAPVDNSEDSLFEENIDIEEIVDEEALGENGETITYEEVDFSSEETMSEKGEPDTAMEEPEADLNEFDSLIDQAIND
jgi:penicillin-binding protein 1A